MPDLQVEPTDKWCSVCHDIMPLSHDTAHPFACATCGESVPDEQGGDDEFPDDCAACWAAKTDAGVPGERAV